MTEELVTITVDGQELKAPKGAMLISVTDDNGIRVPRFCYHKKLSVAANCRMCLVDVEKAPKPMPACATPIMDGMVVHTKSPKAIAAQKSVMEFLLINHPLDCPICDQGGECELQDVSMGYGGDVSQYSDIKRVVFDKDIGPLIETELTRCIQCTRCIRFGEEIAGMRELGATDRGDRMVIGTFIEKSVDSEMSGNVIDICPVGALTAKPSRFAGRAWEMEQHPGVAPHDSVGSNINIHTLRGRVVRVVPRDNEAINEVWISDRDRFSYQGIEAADRATTPMIKVKGEWRECDWDDALQKAVEGLQAVVSAADASQLGAWISPNSTIEEHYLLQKLVRGMGSNNIDHRLRQVDFTDQDIAPVMPWLGQNIEQLEQLDAALLIGSHVRKDQPLIAHRLRKAAINKGASISFVNPRKFDWHFPVAAECASSASGMLEDLAAIAKSVCEGASVPAHVADVVNNAQINESHKLIADSLKRAERATVLLGAIATQHPQLSVIRQLANLIAEQTNSILGYIPEANAAGAWLAGAVPHRSVAGQAVNNSAASISDMKTNPLKGLITFNVEPEFDVANGAQAIEAANNTDCVVAISSYVSDKLKDYADVILPLAAFTETSGTYVNAEGFWQGFKGASVPVGQSRPGWKVLRVLGNLFNLDGFDYVSSLDVKDELKQSCQNIELNNAVASQAIKIEKSTGQLQRVGDVPLYAIDALVRRASALQSTSDADQDCARMNSRQADQSGVAGAEKVKAMQGGHAYLSLVIDEGVPDGCVWISAAQENTLMLANVFGPIELEKV
ncbi:MAG: NADH-quinone oxidoreductase subunit NuoG [Gammaproteobacteria bacterium]|nr:NADH-quinone oxidoreductase subunit NuoG [Gammaproteobacteria bacterium]